MHDNVQWLVRSSQKDIESAAFSHLATKIGEEPKVTRLTPDETNPKMRPRSTGASVGVSRHFCIESKLCINFHNYDLYLELYYFATLASAF